MLGIDEAAEYGPAVAHAMSVALNAKQAAEAATARASVWPTLESTPAHNTVGEPLRDALQPVMPAGEKIIAVRIHIDGAELNPPCSRVYTDEVLWNCLDDSLTPEAFARLTREEVGLPPQFEPVIALQIARAAAEGRERVEEEGGGIVVLEIRAAAAGVEVTDKVLWDTSDTTLTPEAFAKGMCADLGLGPEVEVALVFSIREQLASKPPPYEAGEVRVRSEEERREWGPTVSSRTPPAPVPPYGLSLGAESAGERQEPMEGVEAGAEGEGGAEAAEAAADEGEGGGGEGSGEGEAEGGGAGDDEAEGGE